MKILFLDHGTTLGGGQVMAARLLPLLRERFEIDALVGCPQLDEGRIPTTMHGKDPTQYEAHRNQLSRGSAGQSS